MNSNHEAAVRHENAAKAHMIAAKHYEKEAQAAVHGQEAARQEQRTAHHVEPGSAWYHDAAVEAPGDKRAH